MSPAPAQPKPRIVVRNLHKSYGRRGGKIIKPVNDISLSVDENELLVLLGPSGCGKTTFLRCIAGLERPDSGEIIIDGETVYSSEKGIFLTPDQRRLSMIFQSYALWPHMTVFRNVAYPLESLKIPKDEIARRVNEALSTVGIDGLQQQYPNKISGGQQQRVALARALVANTSVILFDEPLSNVDAQVRAQLRFELNRMQEEIKFTGVFVTHDQAEAMELGHRIAVFDNGHVSALDTPENVYRHPPNLNVASFIGVANIIGGRIVDAGHGGTRIATAVGELTVTRQNPTGSAAPAFAPRDEVSAIVRPEDVVLLEPAAAAGRQGVGVRILSRAFAGPYNEYIVSRGSDLFRVWATANQPVLAADTDAWLHIPESAIHLIPGGPRPEGVA